MSRLLARPAMVAVALAVVPGLAACGGKSGKGGGVAANTLHVVSADDFDSTDPGVTYLQTTYEWLNAAHRTLYSYAPGDASRHVPDLASGPPQVSADARTITVHIKKGVRFSPPVNRAVTSADVKYAIERGFSKEVSNQYALLYFGDLVGAPTSLKGDYRPIPGIATPDAQTIVFKLAKPVGAYVSQALALPLTAPVPKAYARPFDRRNPSQYGSHQVATGPYMIQSVGGKLNYKPGRSIVLVRNPNWDAKSDFRPAHVDRIDWKIGGDETIIARQVLTGSHIVDADGPPASILKQAVTQRPSQIAFTPLGNEYVNLNTSLPPFDDINLRKAVSAAIDKTQLQLTRGGAAAGYVATHLLPPGAPGFEQAGGFKGPGYDFDASATGNMAVATKYMKAAGFATGKYHGPAILAIADRASPSDRTAAVVVSTLEKLGFEVNLRSLDTSTMQTACSLPKTKVQVCPNGGWIPDFADGQAYLDGLFSGEAIDPRGTTNWSQLDDPGINAAMDRAALIADPARRAAAWGRIDSMITATAAAIPWLWDRTPSIRSKDVKGVLAKWNAAWDLSFTSLD